MTCAGIWVWIKLYPNQPPHLHQEDEKKKIHKPILPMNPHPEDFTGLGTQASISDRELGTK